MGSVSSPANGEWRQLDIAVIGGGIGGLCASISLRRAGHKVTIYERAHFAGEVGASISCAVNGGRWLHEWGVNVDAGRPVELRKLIAHDWKTGEVTSCYDLKDYKKTWGREYYMFHRVDMHKMLLDDALLTEGEGIPVKLVVDHKCVALDVESGTITFANGATAQHEVVIGADGVGSAVRTLIGVTVDKQPSTSTCLHANVATPDVHRLGLKDFGIERGIEYWGGQGIDKIVVSPCQDAQVISFYCFFPRSLANYGDEGWNYTATVEELLAPFPELDKNILNLLQISTDIKPWRLFVHQPYTHWTKGVACIMGDAAHPMMPDQSQGACQAIEDSAALGLVFGKQNFKGDIKKALEIYEKVRKPRATRVQAASARARLNIMERIGFSSDTKNPVYRVANENEKLTIEEMNLYDMKADVASYMQ